MTDATKKLIQDLNTDLLSKLHQTIVKENVSVDDKRTDAPKPMKKNAAVAAILKEIEKTGVKRLAEALKVADSELICEALKIDFKDDKKQHSRNTISKRLKTRVVQDGLESVLGELDSDLQTTCADALGITVSGSTSAVATKLASEVRRVGAGVVLSKMEMSFLRSLGEEMGLDVYDINSQNTVIEAILTGKVPAKRARVEPKKEKISKTKPKLEAGISIADMMQHYNLTELQDFARENSLMVSGKKKDVMKRIAAFFEDDGNKPAKKAKKETKKEDKEEKKEEAKSPKKDTKKKDTKKAEEKKEESKSPKKDTKKKGKKDAEEAEEAEEAEVAEAEPEKETKKEKKDTKKETKEKKEETKASPKKAKGKKEALDR